MESISDIFGNSRFLTRKGTPQSERSSFLTYFLEHARDRKGKLTPARMGMILSHLRLPDLYYMKSVLESETRRGANWNKVFWGMLKTGDK